jgi:NADH dehydrogenase [ubiquinone] 1 alpha subcomplex assembly factor 6
MPTLEALETHISKTSTPLYYLELESLGLPSLELDHISSHISLCMGIISNIRGIPFRLRHRELPLPLDICAKHGLVQESVFREGPQAHGLKDVIFEVATRANDHLSTLRQYIEELRKKDKKLLNSAFCVFVPAVPGSFGKS